MADYAKWRKGYYDFANYQKTHGVIDESVYQSIDGPNDVTVIHDFHSIDEAKAFATSAVLAESMSTLGVKGVPHIWYTVHV